jgi:hypothetical protein
LRPKFALRSAISAWTSCFSCFSVTCVTETGWLLETAGEWKTLFGGVSYSVQYSTGDPHRIFDANRKIIGISAIIQTWSTQSPSYGVKGSSNKIDNKLRKYN